MIQRVQPPRDTASVDHSQFKSVHTESRNNISLSGADVRHLSSAHAASRPLVLKGMLSPAERQEIATSWRAYVASSGPEEYSTYEHSKHTLRTVWNSPLGMRMETSLKAKAEGNTVEDWLARSPEPTVQSLHAAHKRLVDFGTALSTGSSTARHPSFVTGRISNGSGSTHQDYYVNLALVVVGCKVFYVANSSEDGVIDTAPVRGESHERRGVNPYNSTSFAPLDSLDCVSQDVWSVAVLEPGDILYLPLNYWHWVYSVPHSVMTNVWTH